MLEQLKKRVLNVSTMSTRLVEFHDKYVDETCTIDGAGWYLSAHTVAALLAHKFGCSVPQCAGILSALSPSVLWETNILDAETFIRLYLVDTPLDDITVSTYGQNKDKCERILQSDGNVFTVEDQFTVGTKTHAFYWNILSPHGTQYVTVDRHAIGAVLGSHGSDHMALSITKKRYRDISSAYVQAAQSLGYQTPATLQATIWTAYRDNFGGRPTVYKPSDVPF